MSQSRTLSLWGVSLLLVLGLHVGLACWALFWRPHTPPVELPPAAMMVELEPAPVKPPPPPPKIEPEPEPEPEPKLVEAPKPTIALAKPKPVVKPMPKPKQEKPPEPKPPQPTPEKAEEDAERGRVQRQGEVRQREEARIVVVDKDGNRQGGAGDAGKLLAHALHHAAPIEGGPEDHRSFSATTNGRCLTQKGTQVKALRQPRCSTCRVLPDSSRIR